MPGSLLLAASILFHGVMGQSAPYDAPPLGFTGLYAMADGPQGRVFALGDDARLYEIRDGAPFDLGCPAKGFRLDWDGKTLRSFSFHDVWEFDFTVDGVSQRHALGRGDRRFDLCAVLPEGRPKHPFAGKGKFFFYDKGRDAIIACDAKADELSELFRLPARTGDADITGIAFLPLEGDLLVASGYPDLRIYRFGADGRAVDSPGWPVRRGSGHFARFGDRLFHCSGTIAEIDGNPLASRRRALDIGPCVKPAGFATDGMRDYVATSLGLLVRDPGESAFRRRLGGIGRLTALAASGPWVWMSMGGTIRWMYLDNGPDDPFVSSDDDRLRFDWTHPPLGIVPAKDGETLLVDGGEGGCWRFDPFPDESAKSAGYWTRLGDGATDAAVGLSPSKELLDRLSAVDVPGGFEVGKMAVSGKWLVVEDTLNHRLLRFLVTPAMER